jgi:WD40 repeat protein
MAIEVNRISAFTGHRDCVYALQPGEQPNVFFSAAGDGMVVQWNLDEPDQGQLVAQLPNSIYSLLHLPEAGWLVAGHNYDGIHLIDYKNKTELGSLALTKAAVFDLQTWEDTLFVATGDGFVTAVGTGRLQLLHRVQSTTQSARTIAVHDRLGEIAVGFSDHHIRVFDARTLACKTGWKAHDNSVFAVRYSPDGRYLLSVSRDARLKVWDASTRRQEAEVVAHMYAINHLDFSPDGKHFVTCSMDKSIKVWSFEELQLLKVIDKARHAGHGTSVNKVLWTNPRGLILSASDDRTISSWLINLETTS